MDAKIIMGGDFRLIELSKFSPEMIYTGVPITDNRLLIFEKQIGYQLPEDFKYLLTKYNGFSLSGTEVYGLDENLRGSSLDQLYQNEHFEVGNKMPLELLPFSPDGSGNHYCFNLSMQLDGTCRVVFWQHDYQYETINDIEICNENFYDWIDEVLIGWTLEDYNYDGSSKS